METKIYQLAFNYKGVGYELVLDLSSQALNIAINGINRAVKYKEFNSCTYDYIYKINKRFVGTRNVNTLFDYYKQCINTGSIYSCIDSLRNMYAIGV